MNYFKESTHEYFINNEPYDSVSSILKLVEPIKDWEQIALNYSKKHNIPVEEVKAMWNKKKEDSCNRGTLFHKFKEGQSTGFNYEIQNDIKVIPDLRNLEDGTHLELSIYNNKHKICGTADKVIIETVDKFRFIDIDDFKTNSEIEKVSYFNARLKQYEMLEPPCAHLMATNLNKYALQLSMYAYFLEQYGFIPRTLRLLHNRLEETTKENSTLEYEGKYYWSPKEEVIEVPYLKKEVKSILKKHDNKNIRRRARDSKANTALLRNS